MGVNTKVCLKTAAKQEQVQSITFSLHDRLPERMLGPCLIHCDMHVARSGNYYSVTLNVRSDITLVCQRCLEEFPFFYENQTNLAVCANDETAESLMELHECLVAPDAQMELIDVLTDELHLFVPERHLKTEECDVNIIQWLGLQTKTR